jgi:integrase
LRYISSRVAGRHQDAIRGGILATFRKRGKTWRVEVKLAGVRDSTTRATKAEAAAWAAVREAEIRAGLRGEIIPRTVRQAFERYADEVSPSKGGARWERIRLAKLAAQLPFAGRLLSEVHASDIADWRERAQRGTLPPMVRLLKNGNTKITPARPLTPASVRREMNLVHSVFEIARKEWGWLAKNPMDDVARPAPGRPRDRRITQAEIETVCDVLGLGDGKVATTSQRVAVAFLFALETAMRAGEITGLTWDRVHVDDRYAELPKTKNGDARKVPLSKAALALLERLPRTKNDDHAPVFGVTSASLDALFRKARSRAGLAGFTFHDSRAEALTRLSRKVDVLTLARIAGHRDVRSLLVYYRESAADIAARLD